MSTILQHATRIAGSNEHMVTKIDYVLRTFGQIYSWSDFGSIAYNYDQTGGVEIFQSDSDIYLTNRNLLEEEVSLHGDLPILFHNKASEVIIYHDDRTEIGFDLFAATFYFLSGWQEYVCDEFDQHGRYPYSQSIQSKYDVAMKPVVNYYFEILCDAIERSIGIRPVSKLWGQKTFGYHLSHDVDLCRSGWMSEVKFALKKGSMLGALKVVWNKAKGQDPYDNLSSISSLEKQQDIASTFFFLPETKVINGIDHADYEMTDATIQRNIEEIKANGSQVMLHGSVGTSEDLEKLQLNNTKIGRVDGNRFHFLCWSQKKTPAILEKASIKYDASLGFAEHIGFRNGICHPFYLFDIVENRMTDVLEYPLMIMDTTFHNRNYMSIDKDAVLDLVKEVMFESIKFHGMVSVLWHNNYFTKYKYQGWGELYWHIISCFQENDGKSILLEDVYLKK